MRSLRRGLLVFPVSVCQNDCVGFGWTNPRIIGEVLFAGRLDAHAENNCNDVLLQCLAVSLGGD